MNSETTKVGDEIGFANVLESRSSTVALRALVNKAESTTGQQLVEVIKQALESSVIYVFGELLQVENVLRLSGSEHEPWLTLLSLFAYDKYSTYVRLKQEQPHSLPDLNGPMLTKLRQLSIVSLACTSRRIPYQVLLEELHMQNIRELEDLIIELIYANVIKGMMNQKASMLEIESTIGRDVRKKDFATMIEILSSWCRNCDHALSTIEQQIGAANQYKLDSNLTKQNLEQRICNIRQNLKLNETEDVVMTDANGPGFMREPNEKTKRIPTKHTKGGYRTAVKTYRKDSTA